MKEITIKMMPASIVIGALSASIFLCADIYAQQIVQGYSLGTVKEFTGSFVPKGGSFGAKADPSGKQGHIIRLSDNKEVAIINVEVNSKEDYFHVFGTIEGHDQSRFFFNAEKGNVKGKIIFLKTKEAYDIYTNEIGEVCIASIDINKVICVDYNEYKEEEGKNGEAINNDISKNKDGTMVIPLFNSLPGAFATIYLDFDGEFVSGGNWGTINALPSSFTDANITNIWTSVSEDYSPFNVNITTDRAVYLAANPSQRLMVIFTPTNTAAPGAGGVANLGSWGSDDLCWVFNGGIKGSFEAASHESGHTFGLTHDGTPSQGYYSGHANWGPIMGTPYLVPIGHWSKGEYADANNQQDDLAYISGNIPYRVDDHGNDPSAATLLIANASGTVDSLDNPGVIETRTDKDVFKFTTTGGNVNLSITPKPKLVPNSIANLDIQARLLDAGGTEIVKVDPKDPSGLLTTPVSISQNLSAGTYYIEIDGVGFGSPLNTGYSDYGSLGQFSIYGSFPTGTGTGIEAEGKNNGIDIYPNPNSGSFNVNLMLNSSDEIFIETINNLGQVVMTSSEKISGNYHGKINLPDCSTGIYCVVVKAGNEVWKEKVIIK